VRVKSGANYYSHSSFSHHSPLEGESRQPSRQARLLRWGHAAPRHLRFSWTVGRSRSLRCSPHRRDFGLAPSSCRLPLKGGVMRKKQSVQKPRQHPEYKALSAIPTPSSAMPLGSFSRGFGFSEFLHSLERRNPSFSCDLGIAKEREARALFAGFPLSREWRGGVYSLDSRPCSSQGQALRGNGGKKRRRRFLHGLLRGIGRVGAREWRNCVPPL